MQLDCSSSSFKEHEEGVCLQPCPGDTSRLIFTLVSAISEMGLGQAKWTLYTTKKGMQTGCTTQCQTP